MEIGSKLVITMKTLNFKYFQKFKMEREEVVISSVLLIGLKCNKDHFARLN